jgi:hypothetical protein
LLGGSVVDGRWGVQSEPGVVVLVVVVVEELLAEEVVPSLVELR